MKVSEFNYELPEKYIAQYPPEVRGTTNLLVVSRKTEEFTHSKYHDLHKFLNAGDTIVLNDTKVIPARLFGVKTTTGAKIEVFLLEQQNVGSSSGDTAAPPTAVS